jgi:RNA polymerase sigma-70 factor (ECF subfamily)
MQNKAPATSPVSNIVQLSAGFPRSSHQGVVLKPSNISPSAAPSLTRGMTQMNNASAWTVAQASPTGLMNLPVASLDHNHCPANDARVRAGPSGPDRGTFKADLLAAVPRLRAFAISLSGHRDRADDLVQETLLKAWEHASSFREGTNLSAWLFTILRNAFITELRKRRREVDDSAGQYAAQLHSPPNQPGHMDLLDFRSGLQKLAVEQREALILVGASGMTYEEAAEICGCAVGTVKSRVHRARVRLGVMLSRTDAMAPSVAA